MSMAGISGNGKNGSVTLQTPGQSGSQTGMALAEALLAGVTGDGGKASDSPMLQNAIRFQGALESVSAQANAVNTPKMAPDAPILRGYTTSIDLPVSHAEWGDKVAGKLTWLTARNMSVAEIHLTPPDMGPMEVKVQVQQEQANITVHSANPVVREQLELHSHRLRDMLSDQGISLENFDVSDSGSDQTRDGETESDERAGQGLMSDAAQEDMGAELRSLDLTWKGEVDIFA
jgi:flagellar hook-length control protein FliK